MLISPTAAYILDLVGQLITKASYLIMKIAHHQLENDPQKENLSNLRVYCTFTMFIGLLTCAIGSALEVLILPYIDLVLLSITVALSIVFSNLLAVKFLGEKIVWKYDLLALLLVIGGCSAIMLLCNLKEKEYAP